MPVRTEDFYENEKKRSPILKSGAHLFYVRASNSINQSASNGCTVSITMYLALDLLGSNDSSSGSAVKSSKFLVFALATEPIPASVLGTSVARMGEFG